MAKINANFKRLEQNYLFAKMARRVTAFKNKNPEIKVIPMGIGDVTRPLPPVVVEAIQNAATEQLDPKTFKGYSPAQGYEFLRRAVAGYYHSFGTNVELDDIFISDGAKSDVANITDLFSKECVVAIPNPVYPVYLDTNIMDGREMKFLEGNMGNGFLPMPPDYSVDLIYLCSPNNPTGATYNREQLTKWVDYANKNEAVIFYDSAYEAFIGEDTLPRSIFQIKGAETCAIEFCSLSKTAGFTGVRCGYTVISSQLKIEGESIAQMWRRRQSTKFNGVSYIIQKGAEAVFSPQGLKECSENIKYYKKNTAAIKSILNTLDMRCVGGECSPYVWAECQKDMDSWEFFDYLLVNAGVIITPGVGFGKQGEGYIRISGFGDENDVREGMERIKMLLKENRNIKGEIV